MGRAQVTCVLLFLCLAAASPEAQPKSSPSSPSAACGNAPVCPAVRACELRQVPDQRDTRDCRRPLFLGIVFTDPACEAAKAQANQMAEAARAVAQQDFRQCLVAQESERVACELRQSEWEKCISKELPQFPPRTPADRRFLYQRCLGNGGKDELTVDCCTHLYVTDRSTLNVCSTPAKPKP